MKKIYFVSLYYRKNLYTGANKRFDELGRIFASKLGENFRIIVCDGEKPDWASAEICVFVSRYTSKLQRLRSFLELRSVLSSLDSGHVISDFMPIPFSALKKHWHYQLIYDLRNFTEFERGGLSFLTSRFQQSQLARSNKIITISQYSREDIVARCGVPRHKILVSYCGITPNYLIGDSKQRKNIDILYVASFESRKNHINLLKALAHSPTNLKISLVGRDLGTQSEARELAKQLTSENGSIVEFKDSISESALLESYRNSKLYVFPSFLEGFGMPLIEAMAMNCKVACSDIEVFRELCGENAHYFDPKDPKNIWETIEGALATADQPNHASLAQKFLWHNISENLLEQLNVAQDPVDS
ncbi:MAG TPA: glycosyltransferase family 1 protein [Woeseiaceae bacterium]|nr:glycosyltransferase family 1 protein [Woeseiaceae bacterium]